MKPLKDDEGITTKYGCNYDLWRYRGRQIYTSAILTSELDEMGYYVVYIPNSYENFETLICSVVRNIADKSPTNITEATLYFEEILKTIEQERNQLVIILDECHTYSTETRTR